MKKRTVILFGIILFFSSNMVSIPAEEGKEYLMIESLTDVSLVPKTYVLGPGDRLNLHLWGNVNAEYGLRVSHDGTIFIPRHTGIAGSSAPPSGYQPVVISEIVPSLGEIMAEGLTLGELEIEIEKRIKKYYRGVNVWLSIFGLRTFYVSILGSVMEPGTYAVTPLYRLSNLITLAGGIIKTGSYRNIEVFRSDGEMETYDLYEFLYWGNMDQNPYIEENCVVTIPQAIMSVKISGRILRRGIYELKEGERLKDLIEIAGGFQQRGSLTRSIKVFNVKNPDDVVEVNPYKLMIENDSLSNIELHTGDVVTVPMEPFTITVVGQVTRGGTFEYEPGADFNYYLGLAGGYGERANEGDIRITRWDGTRLKWNRDVEIKPGDTIVIGRSELKGWRDYLQVTLNAANLLFIIWTISTVK